MLGANKFEYQKLHKQQDLIDAEQHKVIVAESLSKVNYYVHAIFGYFVFTG